MHIFFLIMIYLSIFHNIQIHYTISQYFFFFPPRCRELNAKSPLKFVHSSFHGVGHNYVQTAFQQFGFPPPIPVPEQKDPDPNFSTVSCPNPEEGESVLVRFSLSSYLPSSVCVCIYVCPLTFLTSEIDVLQAESCMSNLHRLQT